ncbi:MAG: DUF4126 domain-containing protein [Caldilineales bacterium]
MIESLSSILTAFGLSSSAGLNAYLPLLIVALTARFTSLINLQPPYDWLTSWWVIGVLAVLLLIEIVADKVPVVDHANDVIQTAVRPAAGALLFAANTNVVTDIHPALALVAGLLVAGGVHATKATVRPVVTATTGGLGNPVVSTIEDIVALVVSVLAILLPVLTFIALVVLVIIIWTKWRRYKARRAVEPTAGL